MPPAHHCERCFGGTEHARLFGERRRRCETARKSLGRVLVGAGHQQAREPSERRIMQALARGDLRIVERFAILCDQRLHHRMLGLVRL